MGALKYQEVTTLYPFDLIEVSGKIQPCEYFTLIQSNRIPLAKESSTHHKHDMERHITPTLKYINAYGDLDFMKRVHQVVHQEGNREEKIIDYVTFELVSGLLLAEHSDDIKEGDITDYKTMALVSEFFFGTKLTEEQIKPRWIANLKTLQVRIHEVKQVVEKL